MMGAMFETFEMFVFEVFVVWFGDSAVLWFGRVADVGGVQMRGRGVMWVM
jgi:membrane protein implicated in regulation of membrane protease activity